MRFLHLRLRAGTALQLIDCISRRYTHVRREHCPPLRLLREETTGERGDNQHTEVDDNITDQRETGTTKDYTLDRLAREIAPLRTHLPGRCVCWPHLLGG